MDRSTFESANPILDEIAVTLDELLDSDQFAAVRLALTRLNEAVGPRYTVNLNVCVDVFDAEWSVLRLYSTSAFRPTRASPLIRPMVTQRPRNTWSMARFRSFRTTAVPSVMGRGTLSSNIRLARSAVRPWVKKSSCS